MTPQEHAHVLTETHGPGKAHAIAKILESKTGSLHYRDVKCRIVKKFPKEVQEYTDEELNKQ